MPITLRNNTSYIAQYVVKKGDLVIARLPGIAPGALMVIPTENTYEIVASTLIDGNTYISAPNAVTRSASFLAQILQVPSQGTYVFDVQVGASLTPNQLSFQSTCINPVTFTITKDGRPLQSVVANDPFIEQTLDLSDTFHIYAVINGVTTETLTTDNANAVVTAETSSSDLEAGYFTLSVA
jgi:hypothetical protein